MTNVENPSPAIVPVATNPNRWMDYNENEVFFPIASIPVVDNSGEPTGYQRVHRQDTDKTLAIHKSKYTMTPYQDKVDILIDAVEGSTLDRDGMEMRLTTTHEGRKLFVGLDFPMEYEHVGEDDGANLSINMWDSYDGSSANIIKAGCYRKKCKNGWLIGNTISGVHKRHIGEFKPEEIYSGIVTAIESWRLERDNFRLWNETPIREGDAYRALVAFTDTQSLQDRLFTQFREETQYSQDSTVWNLVNSLTSWATHTKSRTEANAAQARKERQLKVLDFQNSPAFAQLVH